MVLPVIAAYGVTSAVGFFDCQREFDAVALQSVALVKIEDKIAEEFIDRRW